MRNRWKMLLLLSGLTTSAVGQGVPPARPALRWQLGVTGALRTDLAIPVRPDLDGRVHTLEHTGGLWGLEVGYGLAPRWVLETGVIRFPVGQRLVMRGPAFVVSGLDQRRQYQLTGYGFPLRVAYRLARPGPDTDPQAGLFLTAGAVVYAAGEPRTLGGYGYRIPLRTSPQVPPTDTLRFSQLTQTPGGLHGLVEAGAAYHRRIGPRLLLGGYLRYTQGTSTLLNTTIREGSRAAQEPEVRVRSRATAVSVGLTLRHRY
jgi:hypothetical protein